MNSAIPSAEAVRAALAPLSLKQLEKLAELSGVPFTTIYKVKRGETRNPGIETLRQFMPHLQAASAA
jgi:predicted transcriptional regulator